MRRGYSYLELILTVGLLAVIFSAFLLWRQDYVRQLRGVQAYYQERQEILNRIALNAADRTEQKDGYKQNEISWRNKKIIWFAR